MTTEAQVVAVGPPPGWSRRFPARPPGRAGRDEPAGAPRMRVLCVVPSTNQMYSGVGRALKELAARMTDRVAYEFAVDDLNGRNLRLLQEFADAHGLPVHVGRHAHDPLAVDPANRDLPALLARGTWDAVELVGFANAATGRAVLEGLGGATLCYTPHDQPLWTVPMDEARRRNVAEVHGRVVARADLVLADSPHERSELQRLAPGRSHVVHLPLGCDFDRFAAGPADRPPQLLFVGDLNEIRKRFDRVAALFAGLHARRPDLRLVVVGNRSDELADRLPQAARDRVDLRGYVSEEELGRLYRSSRGLVLLSDVEAFGLPILEALASGTPVFLSRLPTTAGLFGDCPGAVFCPQDDAEGTLAVVDGALGDWRRVVAAAIADRPRLRDRFDWPGLADRKVEALKGAWYGRNCWSWPA